MNYTEDQLRVVRTLIPDNENVFGPNGDEPMFSDSEITDFLIAGKGSVLRAAGHANMAIATSEALISKKIQTQDLQTDGASIANSLVNKARQFYAEAKLEDEGSALSFFEIIDFGQGWTTDRPELTEYGY